MTTELTEVAGLLSSTPLALEMGDEIALAQANGVNGVRALRLRGAGTSCTRMRPSR